VTDPATAVAELRALAGEALRTPEINDKAELLMAMGAICAATGWPDAGPAVETTVELVAVTEVGRPAGVRLVTPRQLKRRTWGSQAGRFATVHALAHIEANAVNLALDAVHRFGAMPASYYADWVAVAAEELGHFVALGERMAANGGSYGDLGCHDGLWEIAVKTAHDVGARMALVPLVFEARGLDVTPGLIERFDRHGDPLTADVLRVVLADEIGHVEVGSRWFGHICTNRGLDPRLEFDRLVAEAALLIVPPFNTEARLAAGFVLDDLERWEHDFLTSRAVSPPGRPLSSRPTPTDARA